MKYNTLYITRKLLKQMLLYFQIESSTASFLQELEK